MAGVLTVAGEDPGDDFGGEGHTPCGDAVEGVKEAADVVTWSSKEMGDSTPAVGQQTGGELR
ncbi:hypothetical protein [Streptomyces tendae]|uniref:hypothetical protein n=1 Tax=Streptomyces tendae TaxID=1932 RepID=UPI00364FBA69